MIYRQIGANNAIMKIQLSSTLPFTPLQLDARHVLPRRAVGLLFGVDDGREYSNAVYQFSHTDDDVIHYQVDQDDRSYLDSPVESVSSAPAESAAASTGKLVWIKHDATLTYKPYSFLVMNAITKLVSNWDGVVYRTPSGERLKDSALSTTLQVIDACVCNKFGLWGMVNLNTDRDAVSNAGKSGERELGWVPL